MARRKQRIAILGGGVGALTTAFELSSRPGWRDRFEITVYQMGWRLGGKGASGRNAKLGQRVEEHGLHILIGFYENAFSLMDRCYAELGRSPDAPLPTWREALIPQDHVILEQRWRDGWVHWPIQFPTTDDFPASDHALPSAWHYLEMLACFAVEVAKDVGRLALEAELDLLGLGSLRSQPEAATPKPGPATPRPAPATSEGRGDLTRRSRSGPGRLRTIRRLLQRAAEDLRRYATHEPAPHDQTDAYSPSTVETIEAEVAQLAEVARDVLHGWSFLGLLHDLAAAATAVVRAAESTAEGAERALASALKTISAAAKAVMAKIDRALLRTIRDTTPELVRSVQVLELTVTVIRGMVDDGLICRDPDWGSIDHLELRDWFKKHGANSGTADSQLVQCGYDLIFAFNRAMAAGVGLYGALRLFFTYRGSIFWKMKAGMGDTIFAPLYQVLSARGVRFEFFQRVDQLVPSADGCTIDGIVIGQQAQVADPGGYDPLVSVKGLPCWPSEPDYEQLVQGQALRDSGEDLEDWWTRWQDPVPPITLRRGIDFDQVVLGISLGAFHYIADRLIAQDQAFGDMVRNMTTTDTQAAQLWFRTDLAGLGWSGQTPLLGTYVEPVDTWADMSHLLAAEDWPDDGPKNIAYLVGGLADRFDEHPPPRSEHDHTARRQAQVQYDTLDWLATSCRHLWPKAVQTHAPGALNPAFLYVPPGTSSSLADPIARARAALDHGITLDGQYWTANKNPSDRYNLSPVGTSRWRLLPNGLHYDGTPGFRYQNLVLAGDWTWNLINGGCVEAAAISGMLASKAISGWPTAIVGLDEAILARVGPPPPVEIPARSLPQALPPYVTAPGETVLAQPFGFHGSTTWCFVLPADLEALTKLVDEQYNAMQPNGASRFVPMGPMVVQSWVQIEQAASVSSQYAEFGQLSERDALFAIPVLQVDEEGKPMASSFHLAIPYIWVSNPEAVIQGREIFGYAKLQAVFEVVTDPSDPLVLTKASVAPRPSSRSLPSTPPPEPITWIERVEGSSVAGLRWDSVPAALTALESMLDTLAPGLLVQVASEPLAEHLPGVFLKQFPSVFDTRKAVYQAVITSSQQMTAPAKAGPIDGRYQAGIAAAGADVVAALGLQVRVGDDGVSRCEPLAQFWTTYDFVQAYGNVVWETRLSQVVRDTQTGVAIDRPAYVPYPGQGYYDAVARTERDECYCFLVRADRSQLQRVVDRYLNAPRPGPRALFAPLAGCVLICVQRSQTRGNETSIVLPLVFGEDQEIMLTRLYVWSDDSDWVQRTRELYGSFVELGHLPAQLEDGQLRSSEVHTIAVHDSQAGGAPVMRVIGAPEVSPPPPQSLASLLQPLELAPGLDDLEARLATLRRGSVGWVFLKQFRDIRDGTRACYQSVLRVDETPTQWHETPQPSGGYMVEVRPFMDFEIVVHLGLQGQWNDTHEVFRAPVLAQWKLVFDSVLEPTGVYWEWS